jgi:predicted ATPase
VNIDFRVLGPVEAWRDGIRLELGGVKRRALLALLLLRANEVVPAEQLIHELWGETPPATAANTLQVNVSQLRKAVGAERLAREGGGYVARLENGELDLQRFERATAAGRDALARGDHAAAAARLEEALALWRGPALADVAYEPFAAPEIARLEELRLVATEDLVDARLALGRHAELVGELEALAAEHPLRERFVGRLMLALYRAGRQVEALDVYRRTRERLVDELGIEPSPALQQLEREILRHEPQLAAPAAASARGYELPASPSRLVGRERELAEVHALVREGVRLLTFTGPGGIGKSRLALEAARALAPSFRDGAAFVDLTHVTQPELVVPTILAALRAAPDVTTEERLAAELHDKELVLVLDNFEQIVDAAPLLSRLLASTPRLQILVTSRTLLRIAGEREFAVPPLDPGAGAVELFVDRAQLAAGDDAIREICSRLEGLPLAIELAAARVRVLPPAALLARLTSRLDFLTAGSRDAPERQRTMRAAIDWSYRLLQPEEQLLFARLSVFVGGATLDAIETVCGDVATLDALASLVDKSLLRQRGETEPRFTMLETLREYAHEQLAAQGEEDELRRRHLRYFFELVVSSDLPLVGDAHRESLERLESDRANLRAAIDFAHRSGDGASAVELAAQLRTFWYVHGPADEGLRVLEMVLGSPGDASPLALNKAHTGAAMLASDRGDYAAARRHLERSIELAEALDDRHRMGVAYANLGNLSLYEQDWAEAQRLYEAALELHRGGDVRSTVIALENLGLATYGSGDVERGVELLDEAIARARETEAIREAASASIALARILTERGERERPRGLLADARATFAALDNQARIADALEAVAGVAVAESAHADAARLLGAAAALRESIGTVRQPDQDRWAEAAAASARAALGEDAFAREYAAGRALPREAVDALCATYG